MTSWCCVDSLTIRPLLTCRLDGRQFHNSLSLKKLIESTLQQLSPRFQLRQPIQGDAKYYRQKKTYIIGKTSGVSMTTICKNPLL